MGTPLDFNRALSRFKRLPRLDDVWQASIISLPTWVEDEPGRDPYRPVVAVCLSTTRPMAELTMLGKVDPDESSAAAAILNTVSQLGASPRKAGYRPTVLQVRDPRMVPALDAALDGTDTTVEVAERLPALDTFVREMAAEALAGDTHGALDASGVTPERLRAFADAARRFYEAAPWRHLDDADLLRVEAPKVVKDLSHFCVMGSGGQEFGLSFFASERQHRSLLAASEPEEFFSKGAWGVWFNRGSETPPSDVLAWDEHDLPLASPRAYPVAARIQPGRETARADARQLSFLEGLLRAMAATTEQEMDAGRWSRTADTFDGPVVYTLALPDLLEAAREPRPLRGVQAHRAMERASAEISRALRQMSFEDLDDVSVTLRERFTGIKLDDLPSTASTPLEQAQDVIYQAMETGGRRQLQLIRRALELSPDCADAFVLLAERSSNPDEQRSFYEQAVAAGERALGPEAFASVGRSFWGDVSTRPYMRARFGLADAIAGSGDTAAAIEHFTALLQLNPGDNQGARYRLLSVLLAADRADDAEAVLAAHDEAGALWSYAGVLSALKKGDRRIARTRLRAALRANRHVPKYLTGQRDLPVFLPEHYQFGSHDEAVLCASEIVDAWDATPGATAWLKTEARLRK
jgi:tetratricopeptide (TPR) repeat protein